MGQIRSLEPAVTAHDFIEMPRGLPITVDGQVIGGIGASFDTPEHDVEIAQAGLTALTRQWNWRA